MIGKTVVKKSRKPFKSGLKTATVKCYTVHPISKRDCYMFFEDNSFVECVKCTKIVVNNGDASELES